MRAGRGSELPERQNDPTATQYHVCESQGITIASSPKRATVATSLTKGDAWEVWTSLPGLTDPVFGSGRRGSTTPPQVDPGKLWRNGTDGSFIGKFRDEDLNVEWFRIRPEAPVVSERWRRHYNEVRPHSSLGYLTLREWGTGAKSGQLSAGPSHIGGHSPIVGGPKTSGSASEIDQEGIVSSGVGFGKQCQLTDTHLALEWRRISG